MTLEMMAIRYLRFERSCKVAIRERSPRQFMCGQPDVLGITGNRHQYEIEIKRTLSDFRADNNKLFRHREKDAPRHPRKFWYLVPVSLVQKVASILPSWAGLLTPAKDQHYNYGLLSEVIASPVNNAATPLTAKESMRLFFMMANYNLSLEQSNENWRLSIRKGWGDWEPEYEI